jgi:hypothetical protein
MMQASDGGTSPGLAEESKAFLKEEAASAEWRVASQKLIWMR